MESLIQKQIKKRRVDEGDLLGDLVLDLVFVTSYKIEELIVMPRSRFNQLAQRYIEIFKKKDGIKPGVRK